METGWPYLVSDFCFDEDVGQGCWYTYQFSSSPLWVVLGISLSHECCTGSPAQDPPPASFIPGFWLLPFILSLGCSVDIHIGFFWGRCVRLGLSPAFGQMSEHSLGAEEGYAEGLLAVTMVLRHYGLFDSSTCQQGIMEWSYFHWCTLTEPQ